MPKYLDKLFSLLLTQTAQKLFEQGKLKKETITEAAFWRLLNQNAVTSRHKRVGDNRKILAIRAVFFASGIDNICQCPKCEEILPDSELNQIGIDFFCPVCGANIDAEIDTKNSPQRRLATVSEKFDGKSFAILNGCIYIIGNRDYIKKVVYQL